MKKRKHVLPGEKYGALTVIKNTEPIQTKDGGKRSASLCVCECGEYVTVQDTHLRTGAVKSCGCLKRERFRIEHTKHGHHGETLYSKWKSMRRRCNNENSCDYQYYGGRGIKVCDEWDDYSAFRAWAYSNGYDDTLTIDRIDNSKGYNPENCRWVTMIEQSNNKRNNHFITVRGETHTIAEWSRITGLNYGTLFGRVKAGRTGEQLFTKENMRWKRT